MKTRLLLVSVLVLAACAGPAPVAPAPVAQADADELAIYSVVIDSVLADPAAPFIVIADSTAAVHMDTAQAGLFARQLDPAFPQAAIADFGARNDHGAPFPAEVRSTATVRIFHPSALFTESGMLREQYAEFQRRYAPATSYHTLSRPGFDAGRTRAVIVTGSHCGALCGHGEIVLLERAGSGWRITGRHRTWVS